MKSDAAGLYIHVPFCHAKCEYCDFYSITLLDQIESYVQALLIELELRAPSAEATTFSTIFFGGGTPSLLNADQLNRIWQTLHQHYKIDPNGEFSIESNPGTLEREKLETFRRLGFNRLSMGVQSFNPAELAFLGRIHSVDDVLENFHHAREAGFENINIDLMTAFPGINPDSFQHSLSQALALKTEHISCYTLIFEPGTILHKRMLRGEVNPVSEDQEALYYELAAEALAAHDYQQYEVSNFARGNAAICQHNLIYWKQRPYLGFGPSAHSYFKDARFSNKRSLLAYVKQLKQGQFPQDFEEKLALKDQMFEHIFLRLRLKEGVSLNDFRQHFGVDFEKEYASAIEKLLKNEMIEMEPGYIRLSDKGWLLADAIAAYF